MAEFCEVMKQYKRMCNYPKPRRCAECPIALENNGTALGCSGLIIEEPSQAEKIIMQWAAEHPEPIYPTWDAWYNKNFINAQHPIDPDPCCFMPEKEWRNISGMSCMDCTACRNQPIPAEIAAKLGIKPIGGAQDE